MKDLKILLGIPEEIKERFWKQLLSSNWRLMSVVGVLTILVQTVNIFHVLLGSPSGLETVNNRIYFSFYCAFLLASLGFLALHRYFLKGKRQKAQVLLQAAFCAFWVLWSGLVNYYDIYQSGEGSNLSVIVTSIMGASILVRTIPLYSLLVYGSAAVIFSLAAYSYIRFGGLINVSVAGGMAVIVSSARYWSEIKDLLRQKEIREVNEKLRSEQEELSLSLEKFHLLMEKIDHIIYEWDIEKNILSFSAKWVEDFGESSYIPDAEDWFQHTRRIEPEAKQKLLRDMKKAMREHSIYEEEVRLADKEERFQWYLLRLYFQYGKEGSLKSGVGFLMNIQRQKDELELWEGAASRDYLTGVMNRRGIQEYAEKELGKRASCGRIVMVLIDLNDFKKVNDSYGHPFGDQVLVRTGELLTELFGAWGQVGRIGGDEFMAVLSVSSRKELEEKLETLRRTPVVLEHRGEPVRIGFCAGMAAAREGEDYQRLYQKADQALYQEKETGKGKAHETR